MSLVGLLDVVSDDAALGRLRALARPGRRRRVRQRAGGDGARRRCARSSPPCSPRTRTAGPGRPVLLVTATGREAEDAAAALASLLPAGRPSPTSRPGRRCRTSGSRRARDTVGRRLAVLRRLAHPDPSDPATGPLRVVVAPVRVAAPAARPRPRRPRAGGAARRRRGPPRGGRPAARRRGVHPGRPGREARRVRRARRHPRRVPADRGAPAPGGVLGRHRRGGPLVQGRRPAQPRGRRARPLGAAVPRAAADRRRSGRAPRRCCAQHPELADVLGRLAEGIAVEGMESLAPVLVDELELLVDQLPEGAHVVVCDPERVRARAHDLVATSEEFLAAVLGGRGRRAVRRRSTSARRRSGASPTSASHALALGIPWWSLTPFGVDEELLADAGRSTSTMSTVDADVDAGPRTGPDVVTTGSARRRRTAATPRGPSATPAGCSPTAGGSCWSPRATGRPSGWSSGSRRPTSRLGSTSTSTGVPEAGIVHVATGRLEHGFVHDGPAARRAHRERPRRPARRPPRTCDGCRRAVASRSTRCSCGPATSSSTSSTASAATSRWSSARSQGATREYLVIEYAPAKRGQPGDRLYVPSDALDQVTKYVGGEAPALHRLGGADWAKAKGRARARRSGRSPAS